MASPDIEMTPSHKPGNTTGNATGKASGTTSGTTSGNSTDTVRSAPASVPTQNNAHRMRHQAQQDPRAVAAQVLMAVWESGAALGATPVLHVQQALDRALGPQSGRTASHHAGHHAGHTSGHTSGPPSSGKISDSAMGCFADTPGGSASRLSQQDAALVTELVYGTLRRQTFIDVVLAAHLRAPDKLPLLVTAVLRSSCYALLFLDRVPAHATVNLATDFVKKQFGVGLSRVVNGVLRTITRIDADLRSGAWLTARITDPYEHLLVRHSIPRWVLDLWVNAYGLDNAVAYAAASDVTPWVCVRLNQQHADWRTHHSHLLECGGQSFGTAGIRFAPGLAPDLRPLEQAGILSRQGSGAQEALEACGVGAVTPPHGLIIKNGLNGQPAPISETAEIPQTTKTAQTSKSAPIAQTAEIVPAGTGAAPSPTNATVWEGPVWDACAGRGGKTCFLLEHGADVRLASDPHAGRLRGLREDITRLKLSAPHIHCAPAQQVFADLENTPACPPIFRTIVLDVPCSGLGTLARRPDIALHRTPDHIAGLVATQRDILATVWPHLAPNGRLVYLTCTLNPAENEEQVAFAVRTLPHAQCVRTWQSEPGPYGADMMFVAEIVRRP